MSTAKPIAIIYLPAEILEQMHGQNVSMTLNEMTQYQQKEKPDYYWFVLPDYDAKRMELKVFYEKDFTHAEYHDLLQQINDKFSDMDKFFEEQKQRQEKILKHIQNESE